MPIDPGVDGLLHIEEKKRHRTKEKPVVTLTGQKRGCVGGNGDPDYTGGGKEGTL